MAGSGGGVRQVGRQAGRQWGWGNGRRQAERNKKVGSKE